MLSLQIKKCQRPGCNRHIKQEFIGKSYFCSKNCQRRFEKAFGDLTANQVLKFFNQEFGEEVVSKERSKNPGFDKMLSSSPKDYLIYKRAVDSMAKQLVEKKRVQKAIKLNKVMSSIYSEKK